MSSDKTNEHPASYLAKRLAELEGQSNQVTNPHPSSYLQARLNGFADGDEQPQDELRISLASPPGEPSGIEKQFIRTLTLRNIPRSARAVLHPVTFQIEENQDLALLSLHHGNNYVVIQSSEKTSFKLRHGEEAVIIYYQPGGDDFVVVNETFRPVYFHAIREEASEAACANPRNGYRPLILKPGPWSIMLSPTRDTGPQVLGEILLLRRRYILDLCTNSREEAGRKRLRDATQDIIEKKHVDNSGRVLTRTGPASELSIKPEIADGQYPLDQITTGQILNLSYPASSGSKLEEADGKEAYSLAKMRDIIKTRRNTAVFLGKHSSLGTIAVKTLRSPEYNVSILPKIAKTFAHEVNILKQVDHPCIIKFRGSDARLFSIYMDHLPFQDLASWTESQNSSFFNGTMEDTRQILSGVASALHYLHQQSIYHNDIKPGNIIFDRACGPVLIDFGMATTDATKLTGGTPWYLSEEFLSRKPRGARGDIFALGVTMLYLLRKTQLPDKETPWDIFIAQAQGPDLGKMIRWLSRVEELRKSLRKDNMEGITADMLALVIEERCSAQEILTRLEALR